MPTLDRIRVHPIKALDPVELSSVAVENGGIRYDRKYAMFDADGSYVNGKNYEAVHSIRLDFDTATNEVTVWTEDGACRRRTFDIDGDRASLEDWLSEALELDITLLEATDTRFTDAAGGSAPMEMAAPGPSIVAKETFEEVASWFPELSVENVRKRFRTNLEIADVPPFWEDNLFSDKDHAVEFRIGDVLCRGILPLPRCVVPSRDPLTGERDRDFVEVFTENREAKFPNWANQDHLGDHLPNHPNNYFYLTVVTRIPSSEDGAKIHVGDDIEIVGKTEVIKVL
jgi:uncharacterized protein YcbX